MLIDPVDKNDPRFAVSVRAFNDQVKKESQEDRENASLGIIAKSGRLKQKKVPTIFVFGKGHDFVNNVEEYNKKNPRSRVGLVILSPKQELPKLK